MNKTYLGIELGSTRIKAVAIDDKFAPVSSGDYTWASSYENGIWTYSLDEVWTGFKSALSQIENKDSCSKKHCSPVEYLLEFFS